MADNLLRTSALDHVYREGTFGAHIQGEPGITITERRGLAIVQVATWDENAQSTAEQLFAKLGLRPSVTPLEVIGDDKMRSIWIGPNRWLFVEQENRDLANVLRKSLNGVDSAVTDISHARTVIRLSGPDVRQLLAKGCSLDLHPDMFTPGTAKSSNLGHYTVMLNCVEEDVFDLYIMRSFAESAWEWLTHAAASFGYVVV